ncbi:MAG: hypothetical protein RL885_27405 [Planctomycetota bacterium]
MSRRLLRRTIWIGALALVVFTSSVGADSLDEIRQDFLSERRPRRGRSDVTSSRFLETRSARLEQLGEYDARLERLSWESLDREQRIDFVLLSKLILQERHQLDQGLDDRNQLATYVGGSLETVSSEADGAAFDLWLTRFEEAPLPSRATLSLERVGSANRWLSRERARLVEWCQGEGRRDDPEWQARAKRLEAAIQRREEQLEALGESLGESARWGQPVGAAEMEFRLRHQHLVERSLSELVVLGRSQLRRIQGQMEQLARELARISHQKEDTTALLTRM